MCDVQKAVTLHWATGSKCTVNNITIDGLTKSIALSYNGTSCASGGTLFTYTKLNDTAWAGCKGKAAANSTIPAGATKASCSKPPKFSPAVASLEVTCKDASAPNGVRVPVSFSSSPEDPLLALLH